jgi:hypothetical protein
MPTNLRFEDIDLGCAPPHERAVRVLRSWVTLTMARATREALSGEIRERAVVVLVAVFGCSYGEAVECLISNCADVASVVGVGPHALERGAVPCAAEIALLWRLGFFFRTHIIMRVQTIVLRNKSLLVYDLTQRSSGELPYSRP